MWQQGKFNSCIIILFLVTILVSHFSLALGITPGSMEIDYTPGTTMTASFTISGFKGELKASLDGDLASESSVSETEFYIDKSKNIVVTYTIADNLPPGEHSLNLRITQKPTPVYGLRGNGILALVEVIGRVVTFVPYPSKYLTLKVGEYDYSVEKGKKAYFKINLRNLGNETIDLINGKLEFYSPHKEKVASVPLTTVAGLASMGKSEMYAEWNTKDVTPGRYTFKAIVDYDGNKANTSEYKIYVGGLSMEILNVTPLNASNNQIVPIYVDVKNVWNNNLKINAKLSLKDSAGKVVAESKGPLTELPRTSVKKIKVFLDTSGVKPGNYKLNVHLSAEGEDVEADRNFDFNIYQNNESEAKIKEEKPSVSPVIYAVLGVLVLIVILLSVIAVYLYTKKNSEE